MRSKRLTEKESRRLIWFTWFEFLLVGVIVYFFTNHINMVLFLAGPIALHGLINFWVKSEGVQVALHSVVPTVFMPTAFLAACGSLVYALTTERILNSQSIALATLCVLCVMAIYPESKYADYDWNIHILEWKNPSRYHVVGSFFKNFFYEY